MTSGEYEVRFVYWSPPCCWSSPWITSVYPPHLLGVWSINGINNIFLIFTLHISHFTHEHLLLWVYFKQQKAVIDLHLQSLNDPKLRLHKQKPVQPVYFCNYMDIQLLNNVIYSYTLNGHALGAIYTLQLYKLLQYHKLHQTTMQSKQS